MQIIQNTTDFYIPGKSAVAIGKFDGLHLGHAALLSCILEMKKEQMKAVAFTFYPSAAVYFGQCGDKELTTQYEKRKLFEDMGIDILVEFPLNAVTAAIMPEDFIQNILHDKMNVALVVAGSDITFGYRGQGNRQILEELAPKYDYQTKIIDKIMYGKREISSSFVREEVEKGNMGEVQALLGRYYSFEGTVETGQKLGRRLGMPTMNLYPEPEKLLPPRGVYYSQVVYEGATYPGITNIGRKPTVNDTDSISVETYLYDFDKDMYGKEIVTELLQYKRPEQKFTDVQELKLQMEKDIEEGRLFHRILAETMGNS